MELEDTTENYNTEKSLYGFEVRDVDLRTSDRSNVYDIKRLWQRHHEILGLALQGVDQKDIASMLNISTSTVSNALNSTLGKEKLASMREERDKEFIDISKRTNQLTEKALKIYEDILDGKTSASVALQKNTADTITLDIAGHRAPTKIQSQSIHSVATLEEIEEFKQAGIKAARESGLLVEVVEHIEESVDAS